MVACAHLSRFLRLFTSRCNSSFASTASSSSRWILRLDEFNRVFSSSASSTCRFRVLMRVLVLSIYKKTHRRTHFWEHANHALIWKLRKEKEKKKERKKKEKRETGRGEPLSQATATFTNGRHWVDRLSLFVRTCSLYWSEATGETGFPCSCFFVLVCSSNWVDRFSLFVRTCSLYWSEARLSSSTCNISSLFFLSNFRFALANIARSLKDDRKL